MLLQDVERLVDVELGDAIRARVVVRQLRELGLVLSAQPGGQALLAASLSDRRHVGRKNVLSSRMQPCVQRLAQVRIAERRVGASASSVAAHDDLLDLEMGDGVLDDGRRVDVVGVDAVGDVAVHKEVARPAVAHGRLGDPAVGAANPENLGRLAFAELDEGIRILLGRLLGVNSVSGDDAVDGV